MATCAIEGCDKKHKARGWCAKHLSRWVRNGDPNIKTTKIKRSIAGRYGLLTIIKEAPMRGYKRYYKCLCDCGIFKEIRMEALENGHTKSCGCLHKTIIRSRGDGRTKERLYNILSNMKQRCYNTKNTAYLYYGENGIKICNAWLSDYQNFKSWALDAGYSEELTIDRIDSTGDYEPSNCQWITQPENTYKAHKGKKHIKRNKQEELSV